MIICLKITKTKETKNTQADPVTKTKYSLVGFRQLHPVYQHQPAGPGFYHKLETV